MKESLQRITDLSFFQQNAVIVAKKLIGKYLVHIVSGKKVVVKITETEAYDGIYDDANHAFNNNRAPRNETLFWEGGIIHMFMIYGMHYCFNIVTDIADYPSAVLIRAGEVISDERISNFIPNVKLANGPGKFSRYLELDKKQNGLSLLTNPDLYLLDNKEVACSEITITPRINVDYATNYKNKPYRFFLNTTNAISRK